MRVRVEVRRVQVVEKWVRAADESAALAKVRAEAAEPWGLGAWKTVDMNAEVMEIEGTEGITTDGMADGPMLLSVRDAATQLGISHSSLYPLIQSGEIEHVKIGRRTLISRDALQTFIQANTRLGYGPDEG
jgi:excisionase family DNA binding protein